MDNETIIQSYNFSASFIGSENNDFNLFSYDLPINNIPLSIIHDSGIIAYTCKCRIRFRDSLTPHHFLAIKNEGIYRTKESKYINSIVIGDNIWHYFTITKNINKTIDMKGK